MIAIRDHFWHIVSHNHTQDFPLSASGILGSEGVSYIDVAREYGGPIFLQLFLIVAVLSNVSFHSTDTRVHIQRKLFN